MNINPLFQVGLDVLNRTCLVLGGGREAEEKTGRLLDAGVRDVRRALMYRKAKARLGGVMRIGYGWFGVRVAYGGRFRRRGGVDRRLPQPISRAY